MYIDVFFMLNACLDFLVVSAVNQASRKGASFFRRIIASLTGALNACLFLFLPSDSVWLRLAFGAGTAYLMTWICFLGEGNKERLKLTVAMYGTAAICNGIFQLFCSGNEKSMNPFLFLLLAGLCFLIFRAGLFYWSRQRRKEKYCMKAVLFHQGRKVVLPALLDTGNRLYTYEGHRPVHMAERDWVLPLLGEHPKYHVVPYQAVGTESGALLAVTIDEMLLQRGEESLTLKQPIIGLYEKSFSPSGKYRLLLHADTPLKN